MPIRSLLHSHQSHRQAALPHGIALVLPRVLRPLPPGEYPVSMEGPLRLPPSRNGIGSGSLPGTDESNQAAIRERIETLRQRRAETRLQRRQPSPPRESRGFRSVPSQWLQSRRAVFLFLPILSESPRRHPTPI